MDISICAGSMLAHRLWRWPSIEPVEGELGDYKFQSRVEHSGVPSPGPGQITP